MCPHLSHVPLVANGFPQVLSPVFVSCVRSTSVKRRNTIVESIREFADYMVCLYRSLWLCERLAEHAAESSPTLTFLFCGALIRCRPRARELAQVFCNHGL